MAIFRQHSTKNLCGAQIDGLKFRKDKSTFKFDKLVDRAGNEPGVNLAPKIQ